MGWDHYWQIQRVLETAGWERIGNGSFSYVYSAPGNDRIVKVTTDVDGWGKYIHWAARNGHLGSMAPKVHRLQLVDRRDGFVFAIAVVEKLAPITNEQWNSFTDWKNVSSGYVAFEHAARQSGIVFNDTGGANIMVRPSTGEFVVNDPVTETSARRYTVPAPYSIRDGKIVERRPWSP